LRHASTSSTTFIIYPSSPSASFFFFFSFLRHPPSSTLFPYTTLFRSRLRISGNRRERGLFAFEVTAEHTSARVPGDFKGKETALDRKSTRLNSSHGSISYAVFCLKKKKKKTKHDSKIVDR